MAVTTKTIIAGGGGDYTTVAAWEAAAPTLGTDIWKGVISDNSNYDENVTLSASGTASITSYLWLTVASANRHSGVAGTGHARMYGTGTTHILAVSTNFTRIEWLDIKQDQSGNSDEGIRINQGFDDALISYCIVWTDSGGTDQDGIHLRSDVERTRVDNCVIYGWRRIGITSQNTLSSAQTSSLDVDHCTIYDCGSSGEAQSGAIALYSRNADHTVTFGIFNTWGAATQAGFEAFIDGEVGNARLTPRGTIIWNGSNNGKDYTGTADIDATNNITSWQEATDGVVAVTKSTGSWIVVNNITGGSEDLLLLDAAAGNLMAGNGLDRQGSEPDARQDFSVDIAGGARPTSGVDIGAHQISAAGGQSVAVGVLAEADTLVAIAAVKPIIVAVGVLVETDTLIDVAVVVLGDVIVLPTNDETTKWNRQSGTGDLVFPKPVGAVTGDYLVVIGVKDDNLTHFAIPSGYTVIEHLIGAAGDDCSVGAWYIKEAEQTGDTTLAVTGADADEEKCGVIFTASGVDQGTFLDVVATFFEHIDTNSPNPPAITTVTNFARVVAITANRTDAGHLVTSGGAFTVAPPSGYTIESDASPAGNPGTDAESGPGRVIFGTGNGDAQLTWAHRQIDVFGSEDPGAFANFISLRDHKLITFAMRPAAAGQTVAVGVLAEIDTLIGVAAVKPIVESVAILAEADTLVAIAVAQPIIVAVGVLAGADTLLAIAADKPIVEGVGILAESDTLLAIAADKPIVEPVGVLAEADTLMAVAVAGPLVVVVGTLAESDTLIAVAADKPIVEPVGTLAESDTLVAIAADKPIVEPVGTLAETDTLIAVAAVKPIVEAVGVLAETDTLIGVVAQGEQVVAVGVLAETDTLIGVAAVKPIFVAVGVLVGADTLLSIAADKPIFEPVGVLAETDTLVGVVAVKPIFEPVGVLAEVDILIAIARVQSIVRAVGVLAEIDTLSVIVAVKPIVRAVGVLAEMDSLIRVAPLKLVVIGQISEVGVLVAVGVLKPIFVSVGSLAEADTLVAIALILGVLTFWVPDPVPYSGDSIARTSARIPHVGVRGRDTPPW